MGERKGTEVELKLRVDDLSALMRIAIASGGKPEPTAFQKNRYLDTESRELDKIGALLRLRRERTTAGKRWFLTAKGPTRGAQGGGLTTVQEEEEEIGEKAVDGILAGDDPLEHLEQIGHTADAARAQMIENMRAAIGKKKLVVIGTLKNERTRIEARLGDGKSAFTGVLELDRVTFPGDQVHHEVELEVPLGVDVKDAQAAFRALFAKAGVVGRESPGKARRFFQALRGERLA